METSVKQRLIDYLSYKHISKSEFGKELGVSNAYVTSIRKSITTDKLRAISLKYPDLNITWLVTGEGHMLKEHTCDNNSSSTNLEQELVRTNRILIEQIDRLTIILDRLTK